MDDKEKHLRTIIGKKIKIARSNTNYTQEKLAEKLSLSSKYISQLERGMSFGSASTIVNLCKTLRISSDFLFEDLINVDNPKILTSIDNNFFKTYTQLNSYNKIVLHKLAEQLLTLQKDESITNISNA